MPAAKIAWRGLLTLSCKVSWPLAPEFCLETSRPLLFLPSFPTRRSSDLNWTPVPENDFQPKEKLVAVSGPLFVTVTWKSRATQHSSDVESRKAAASPLALARTV